MLLIWFMFGLFLGSGMRFGFFLVSEGALLDSIWFLESVLDHVWLFGFFLT